MNTAKVSRAEVVQTFLNHFKAPRYLEVGVSRGKTFFELSAGLKVAVDPVFQFEPQAQTDPSARYFQEPSDAWFARQPSAPAFEVIYLDGLHTAEQTLRDLMNAVDRLTPDGVIIIDDVIPSDEAAALPDQDACMARRAATGDPSVAWMGDVFRLLYFIDTFMQSWTLQVVADNHGQAVLWREPRPGVTQRGFEEVASKRFADLQSDHSFKRQPLAAIDTAYAAFRRALGL